MVSFERNSMNSAKSFFSHEEWETTKDLMKLVEDPDKNNAASLHFMAAKDKEVFQDWMKFYENDVTPPKLMSRYKLAPLFAVAGDAQDAKLENLTTRHWALINNLLEYRLRDILYFSNDEEDDWKDGTLEQSYF